MRLRLWEGGWRLLQRVVEVRLGQGAGGEGVVEVVVGD